MSDKLSNRIARRIFWHMRNCRCRTCMKQALQCEDCPDCSERIVTLIWQILGK